MSNRVHVLGVGGVGSLVSVELSSILNKPEITLLFRDSKKVDNFKNVNDSTIHLTRLFETNEKSTSARFKSQAVTEIKEPIENLIITTKTYQTQSAIKPLLHLIKPTTNVLLIQNGMGVTQELYKEVWKPVDSRPNVYQGVITHGAFITPDNGDVFEVSHSGSAPFAIGKVPRDLANYTKDEEYEIPLFIKQLVDAKRLNTVVLPYSDLLVSQIRKFMVNSCINAISALFNCLNGEFYQADQVEDVFYSIIDESLELFYKIFPILKDKDGLNRVEIYENIMKFGVLANAQTSCSMNLDMRYLRDTEIDYINGFIVIEGKEIGMKTPVSEILTNLVKMKLSIKRKRAENYE